MLRIEQIGCRFTHPSTFEIDRPTGLGNYLLLLFQSPAVVYTNQGGVPVDTGTLVLYDKGARQHYSGREVDFCNDWVHFDGEGLEELLDGLQIPRNVPVVCPIPHVISSQLRELCEEVQNTSRHAPDLIDLGLRRLLLKLSEALENEAQAPEHPHLPTLRRLRGEIYNAPYRVWRVPELAAKGNLSVSYFQHLYREFFGVPVSADILLSKLGYAKYLLETSSFSVGYVASLCGYENEVHFMRQFKRSTRLTPSQYRARYTHAPLGMPAPSKKS